MVVRRMWKRTIPGMCFDPLGSSQWAIRYRACIMVSFAHALSCAKSQRKPATLVAVLRRIRYGHLACANYLCAAAYCGHKTERACAHTPCFVAVWLDIRDCARDVGASRHWGIWPWMSLTNDGNSYGLISARGPVMPEHSRRKPFLRHARMAAAACVRSRALTQMRVIPIARFKFD